MDGVLGVWSGEGSLPVSRRFRKEGWAVRVCYGLCHASYRQAETTDAARVCPGSAHAVEARGSPDVFRVWRVRGERIVFMLRDHEKSTRDNGVWLVLSDSADPADPELRREFPSIRPIELLRNKIGHWLLIPSDSPSFEAEALHACDLLLRRDTRLGRVPKSRR